MQQPLKTLIPDFLLCACATVCLTAAVCSGFELEHAWTQNFTATALFAAAAQALFLLLSRRRLTAGLGIAAAAALIVVSAIYFQHAPLEDGPRADALLAAAVEAVCALAAFLLSRSRPGAAALLLLGSLVCAGAQFLQFPAPAWCLPVFLPVSGALLLWRVYAAACRRSELGGIVHPGYAVQAAALCLVALAAAGGIFYGVVRPLDPPTQELRLITVLKSMEQLQVLGISRTETILDPSLSAPLPPEETLTSSEEGEEESDAPDAQTPEPDESQAPPQPAPTSEQTALTAVRYDTPRLRYLWLLVLFPAAAAGLIAVRLFRRRRWHRQVQSLDPTSAAICYYRFFLKRLGRAGLKKPENTTLRAYALERAVQLEPFAADGCTFADLTSLYEQAFYGRHRVTDDELGCFERFYDSFYRALRRELGTARYCLKAFLF